jgi:hypothetical protein
MSLLESIQSAPNYMQPPIQWEVGTVPQGHRGQGVKLTTHLHQALRLSDTPPLPHIFMVRTRTTVPLHNRHYHLAE